MWDDNIFCDNCDGTSIEHKHEYQRHSMTEYARSLNDPNFIAGKELLREWLECSKCGYYVEIKRAEPIIVTGMMEDLDLTKPPPESDVFGEIADDFGKHLVEKQVQQAAEGLAASMADVIVAEAVTDAETERLMKERELLLLANMPPPIVKEKPPKAVIEIVEEDEDEEVPKRDPLFDFVDVLIMHDDEVGVSYRKAGADDIEDVIIPMAHAREALDKTVKEVVMEHLSIPEDDPSEITLLR